MRLDEWLKKEGMRQKAFAAAVDVRESSLSNILRGITRPSLLTAIKIFKFTRGEVGYEEILGEEVEISPKPKTC